MGLCHLLGCRSLAKCLGLCLAATGIRVGNGHLGFILTLHGGSIGLCRTDTSLTHGICLTYLTQFLLFCHTHLGLVDGLGSSLLAQGFDVAALVLDVGNIDIDEFQTNLLEFDLHIGRDSLQELVTVTVEFLNAHGGNNQTELTEEDIARHLLYLGGILSEQTLCGCRHVLWVCADTHGKAARHINADVLTAQGIGKVGINADGVLNDGPHEGTSTMHTVGTLLRTTATTIDDENLVGRTLAVTVS